MEEFKILSHLGVGGYGSVDLIEHQQFGIAAYKSLVAPSDDEKYLRQFQREIEIQKNLRHPNIALLFEERLDYPNYGFVLEFVKYGPVDTFLEEFEVTWEWKSQILYDVASGLGYLHERKPVIIHGDLKCGNILIGVGFHAKISDFGLSRIIQDQSRSTTKNTVSGTIEFIAPEYFADPMMKKTEKFDVYGFAISAWEIFSEKRAYHDFCSPGVIPVSVQKGMRPCLEDTTDNVSDHMLNLITDCWHQIPDQRPTFEYICEVIHEQLIKIPNELKSSYSELLEQDTSKRSAINGVQSFEKVVETNPTSPLEKVIVTKTMKKIHSDPGIVPRKSNDYMKEKAISCDVWTRPVFTFGSSLSERLSEDSEMDENMKKTEIEFGLGSTVLEFEEAGESKRKWKSTRKMVVIIAVPIAIAVILTLILVTVLQNRSRQNEGPYNYGEVLTKSILFYEAQRSGKLPANNRIPYRGDSALGDRGNRGEDLTGGWYNSGDHVKFGFPMACSTTLLLWGMLEFRSGYESVGEYENALDSLRWPLDYFIKCHVQTNEFYGQVGDGGEDHTYWGRPEDMRMHRPAWSITASKPGSDLAAETAAAFAAGYLVYRDADPTYANRLLDNARRLYDFAYNYRGVYSQSISNAGDFYGSNGYIDELAWGAAWLYRATSEQNYLNKSLEFASTTEIARELSWNDKTIGYQLMLFILGQRPFSAPVQTYIRKWMPGGTVTYTPKGLAWIYKWGSLRNSANSAFLVLVASKYGILPTKGRDWARSQIHYILGDTGRSFVCGFGTNPPLRPHHRASSCPNRPAPCNDDDLSNPAPNPQILYGALVGGPDENDIYFDDRKKYEINEVACDYNAGFQGAIAGLLAAPL